MSDPLAINDVLQITYRQTLFSQSIMNVFHARVVTAPVGGTTAEAQLEDLVPKLANPGVFPLLVAWKPAVSHDLFFNDVTVQKVKPVRTIFSVASIASFGTDADSPSTANLAVSFEKRTTFVGRKGIGRMQLAGVSAGYITNGRVSADWIADKGSTLAEAMYGNFSGGALYGGVYTWCLPSGGVDHSLDLYDVSVKTTARTMHRRTVGLGI